MGNTGNGYSWPENLLCELPETTSTRTTTTQPTHQPTPTPDRALPEKNSVKCFNSGFPMSNGQLQAGVNTFCGIVLRAAQVANGRRRQAGVELPGGFIVQHKLEVPGMGNQIDFSFEVNEGCAWRFDIDECRRYMKTPVDSCNCGGTNGKQGGWGQNDCLGWKTDPEWR
ncbi:hypothetical protein QBC34DRAFT_379538 [Podospora aff. communis PSN243]|uniref:Uncharacterized protein n=1 Tax=Podospora aff. communis PSN243 TaxID=3040156 RepID=A0AAV9GP04_9PEZI|nr:hypothetical protein QBC34DRAFT_379538 [Podospora aff. communis PSN243]